MNKISLYAVLFISSLFLSSSGFAMDELQKKQWADLSNIELKLRAIKETYLDSFHVYKQVDEDIHCWFSPSWRAYGNQVTYSYAKDEVAAQELIDEVITKAREFKHSVAWTVESTFFPTNMGQLLENSGFVQVGNFPAMIHYMDEFIEKSINAQIEIKKITSTELDLWLDIVAQGFNYDSSLKKAYHDALIKDGINTTKTEHYALYYQGHIACAGSLHLGGEWVGIYSVATKQEFRGKGLATALMYFFLQRARELKVNYAVLLANPVAERMYSAIGFKKISEIPIYVYRCE
jgi:GNAT superfamily N-acetyltransferase